MSSTSSTIRPQQGDISPFELMESLCVKGNLPNPEFDEPKIEQRSIFPGSDAQRRLFAKIEGILRRYSINPLTKDESGEYVTDIDTVRSFLKKEISDLSEVDALIPLLRLLKEKEWNLNEGDKRVGAYRIITPTVKDLNDVYLGPNQTDDYIQELHHAIKNILQAQDAPVIKSHFKGGVFIIDVDKIETDANQSKIDTLELKLGEIQKAAKEVLLSQLNKRVAYLNAKKKAKAAEIRKLNQKLKQGKNESVEKEAQAGTKEFNKIKENINKVWELSKDVTNNKKGVDVAIGLDTLKAGPVNNYLSIRNAECAANIAALQKLDPEALNGNGKKNGTPFVYMREYSHKELFKHLIRAQFNLTNVLNASMDDIHEEWKPFFTMDKNDYVRMNPDMINTYRHIEKHRLSDEYSMMSKEQQATYEEKMTFFDRYYKTMNIVDFLKNFQTASIDPYLSDIYGIIALVNEAEKLLKEENPDEERMRMLLEHTSRALEVSLKNDSPIEKRVKTTRAAIKAMMEPGMKIMIFGDNICFGAINQSAFEQCAIELINMLGISNSEWQAITDEGKNIDKTILEDVLEKKLKELHEHPAFVEKMLSFDDEGTKHLRQVEEKMYRLYGGNPVINADGGDETQAVYTEQNVPGLMKKMKDPQRELLHFSLTHNIRIAARVDNFQLPAITTAQIQEEGRRKILELIETMEEAEEAHTEIKSLNAQGEHRIILLKTHTNAKAE